MLSLSQSSFHPFLSETESDPRLLFAGEHKLCCLINEVFVVQIMAVYVVMLCDIRLTVLKTDTS